MSAGLAAHFASPPEPQAAIAQAQVDLQRASEDRQSENKEFQQTIADQTVTIEVLKKAPACLRFARSPVCGSRTLGGRRFRAHSKG